METRPGGRPFPPGAAAPANPCRRRRAGRGGGIPPQLREGYEWPRIRASRDDPHRPGAAAQPGLSPTVARGTRRRSWRDPRGAHHHLQRGSTQRAFLVIRAFPPPAARTNVLTRKDRARARRATDAGITAIVQRVVGNCVIANVGPDLVLAPIGQRIELAYRVRRVDLLDFDRATRHRLRAPLAGDPGASSGKRPSQRLGLADGAAALSQLDAMVESVDTVVARVGFDRLRIGAVHLDRNPIVLAHAVDQVIGFAG